MAAQQKLKLGLIAAAAVAFVFILVLLVRLLLDSGERPSAATGGSAEPPPTVRQEPQAAREILLVARDTVDVEVFNRADGSVLFRGTLRRGEQRPLQIAGQVRITTPTGRNLEVESGGVRYRMPGGDYSNATFPPP
jgi:hypothetical protein